MTQTDTDKTLSTERHKDIADALEDMAETLGLAKGHRSILQSASAALRAAFITPPAPEPSKEEVGVTWHRDDRSDGKSILLYTLKQDGWRKGQPAMVNDIMVRIENASGSDHDLAPIAGAILSTLEPSPIHKGEAEWNDEVEAPRDGTIVRLLVEPNPEAHTSFEDSDAHYETIGFNNLNTTGDDEWHFAGWDWSHDCFTEGHGKVLGWLPFASPHPVTISPEEGARVTDDAWRQVTGHLLKEAERMCGPGPMLDALTAALSVKPGEQG